jgi:CheY-like chemotaxis protein
MTANVFQDDIDLCLEAGMSDHLGKPLDADALIRKLNHHIERQKRQKGTVHAS